MSGRRRGGSGRGVAAAVLALSCCLLSAPAANADFDDLFDIVFGAAGGVDVDPGDLPLDPGGFDVSQVLQDPLAQLDQLFHDAPGEPDAGSAADPGPGDHTGSDSDGEATPPADNTGAPSGSPRHDGNSENSNSTSNFPKMPGGGGGNGGGGNGGGSGSPANNAKKANAAATKPAADLPKADGEGAG